MDDYLDLYNYAKHISDEQWQQQIIEVLANKDLLLQAYAQEMQQKLKQDLWKMFDAINRHMLEIYAELRKSQDQQQVEYLRKQVWDLKSQRVDISRKIRRG
ncbi:hypothetical protein [Paenibacillus agricola]|uniref:hypothetical protein n=1 Tax=Paenibacillus agricola TaxID=2716264 RepID=UPI002893197F|nr:hypothetical protein [Paenibacillus agricola]